jgi:hypothetical protein
MRFTLYALLVFCSPVFSDEPQLKDKAQFECTLSAGQYWPGDLRNKPTRRNLFLKSAPFLMNYGAGEVQDVTLTSDDLKLRFDGDKTVPFTKDMVKG